MNANLPRLEFVTIEDAPEGTAPYVLFFIQGIGDSQVLKQWMTEPSEDELRATVESFDARIKALETQLATKQ